MATLALRIFILGIVFAIRDEGELATRAGFLLTIVPVVLFLAIFFQSRDRQTAVS